VLESHHHEVQREIHLVLENGSAPTSLASLQALAHRSAWLHVHWLAKYAPHLNPKEREWRRLKRDARSRPVTSLRGFVDDIVSGLQQLGGTSGCTIVDEVPQWFLDGHRKPPTGRRAGRPLGAKDSYKRAPYHYKRHTNLPADT
jgi:hypothetical protein